LRYTHARIRVLQERMSEAIEELEEVAKDRTQVLGAAHPETERTLNLLNRWKTSIEGKQLPHQRDVE